MVVKNFFQQAVKFGFVGVLNTILGYVVYYILVKINLNYILSMTIAHIIGVTHSFFWNKYFTFKSRKKGKNGAKEILRFVSVYVVTFLLNLILLSYLVEKLSISKELGQLIALSIVTLISFFGHKFWSFKNV